MPPNELLDDLIEDVRRLKAQVRSMYNVVVGITDENDRHIPGMTKGIAERVGDVEKTLETIQNTLKIVKNLWKWILIAVAIGFLLGAIALGWLTFQQAGAAIEKVVK